MKLCIVQNIFAPNEELLNKNIKSLKSLKNIKRGDFYFSGWVAKKEYWDILDPHIYSLSPKKYIKRNKNYGKAYNINLLTSGLNYDLLLTFDSDIIFSDEIDYYKEIENMYNQIDNLGIIAFNQKEQNCHLTNILTSSKMIGSNKYIYNENGGGIAGGCILINFNLWKELGGYRVMGVYAGDDGFLFSDSKNKGKFIAMNEDIYVIHPQEKNSEYQNWKIKVCQRDVSGKEIKNLTEHIKESEVFWNL
jgi:hypothetical protein